MKAAAYWITVGLGLMVVGFYGLLMIGTLFFRPYWIAAGSMKPTLLVGDYVTVDWSAYLRSTPQRGDVVMFQHPATGPVFVKRIIGLPGDSVEMQNGRVILNGTPLALENDGAFIERYERQGPAGHLPRCANGALEIGMPCLAARQRETLPEGRSHALRDINPDSPLDTAAQVLVPQGEYFVLGDNRDNSRDSRTPQHSGGLGTIPQSALKGRAKFILFSSFGQSIWTPWTWRKDRLMKDIQ
ncbi:signal peptidase I [Alphaproteobacteria bacterium KMM 3653]|uniref:Signal peptidase I n=1 Tax=Harenicola maris TaxID=2841044 RepID=A0AAP2GA96_9RHOB|nr:signal peptidase I [Harenicola maris]